MGTKSFKGAIFDLDGVIVDMAKYHYLAWKKLAARLGFDFTEEQNERLKGVSRMRSLEILLEIGGLSFSEDERRALAAKKNDWYREYIGQMDESEVLPGARDYVEQLRSEGIKTALASARKTGKTGGIKGLIAQKGLGQHIYTVRNQQDGEITVQVAVVGEYLNGAVPKPASVTRSALHRTATTSRTSTSTATLPPWAAPMPTAPSAWPARSPMAAQLGRSVTTVATHPRAATVSRNG